ncbi:TIGR03936 family radical SAM-associated protein [Clostridium lacusfryxellense]|uniref:TIGR03936 family radical SAM-associated protein n=1 Tax=Clostridium lacusfryxellense TaxID=205328 RepID=UPI001C0E4016|nr:TIGR03936 family radical SAM-associated protein [Clostridium lacusfryxellense]MBU3110424.1 TIGR03936 family radical SAM-associated protein [Clostridium lacusfryxellense]
MRYLIKYTKDNEIKFVAHLDLMRTLQKIIKRSELPIEYSKGFNPHMAVSIAQPLSVGVHSNGEYMDVVLARELDEEYIMAKMNENTPRGIKILDVVKVIPVEGLKKPAQAMAIIDAAKYTINLKCMIDIENTTDLKSTIEEDVLKAINSISESNEWNIIKKTKSGEKMVNIKPLVLKFDYNVDNYILSISTLITCGSRDNLSARLLADYMSENIESINKESFVDITREEMYAYKEEKLVTLSEFFKIGQ